MEFPVFHSGLAHSGSQPFKFYWYFNAAADPLLSGETSSTVYSGDNRPSLKRSHERSNLPDNPQNTPGNDIVLRYNICISAVLQASCTVHTTVFSVQCCFFPGTNGRLAP
jgi:hypothetical protein